MSSLVPGSLFYSTGLNRKHTPTPPTITNDELQKRYRREPFNGRPWPPSSPISGIYDIRNTSTKLIILNNRKKRDSQLRGRNNPRKEKHRYPEPERHSRCSSPVERDRHSKCLDSSSPYYEPETDLEMDWLNRSQRPQNRFAAGSAVNPKRHTSCQVPSNPKAFDIRLHSANARPNSRISLPANFGKGPIKAYRELTPGEQRYFASITRVYSTNQMVRLKRRQYIDILNQELAKGLYSRKEYEHYRDYIALGRQRQYLAAHSRARSAPVRGRSSYGNDTDRSISSISGDERSSIAEQQDKNEKSPSRQQTKQTTRCSTPEKRPPSTKSNTPSKKSTSSGRQSPDKSPRTSSAKSTKSTLSNKSDSRSQMKEEESEEKINSKSEEEIKDDEDDTDKQLNLKLPRENDASDSDTNIPSEKQYSAREGKDRPKSRLGHIPGRNGSSEDTKSEEDDINEINEEEEKEDKKWNDDSSSTNSFVIENKEDPTQSSDKQTDEQTDKTTKKSRDSDEDSSNSDEENEKDPDKLQY